VFATIFKFKERPRLTCRNAVGAQLRVGLYAAFRNNHPATLVFLSLPEKMSEFTQNFPGMFQIN